METKLFSLQEDRARKQDEARSKKEAAEKMQMLRDARQTADDSSRDLKRFQNNLKYLKSVQTRINQDDEKQVAAIEKAIGDVEERIKTATEAYENAQGILAQAVEEKKKADAKKAQMEALDKAKKEEAAMKAKQEAMAAEKKKLEEALKAAAKDPKALALAKRKMEEAKKKREEMEAQVKKQKEAFAKLQAARKKAQEAERLKKEKAEM